MSNKNTLFGTNAPYLEDLYEQYLQDNSSVPEHWQDFFADMGDNAEEKEFITDDGLAKAASIDKQSRVSQMINAFRQYGHRCAHINPLMPEPDLDEDLKPVAFGLSGKDLEADFATDDILPKKTAKLSEIFEAARTTYCRTIGVQYADIPRTERLWLQKQMETRQNKPDFDKNDQKRILKGLMCAENFEQFLHKKFVGVKRFSLEGGESLIPMLDTMVDKAGESGTEEIVMGMAHRGRLNVLTNILEKPLESTFAEFAGTVEQENDFSSGDVKYHKGKSYDITTRSGHDLHISLLPNPSHLEAVNPVVLGSAHARQQRRKDAEHNKVMPLLIHGDTAFIGQGVVAETLNLGTVDGFNVGGTVHVVINNQLGYTANPKEGFGTEYCTDMARMLQVPIFHVNGNDPEACSYVMHLAMAYRNKFKRDIVIDMVCYRKYGHNEGDDPTFTQPKIYEAIKKHTSAYKAYESSLIENDVLSKSEAEKIADAFTSKMQKALDKAKEDGVKAKRDMFKGVWQDYSTQEKKEVKTAVSTAAVKAVAKAVSSWPEGFTPHPKIEKAMEKRAESMVSESMDWGAAEMAAYGTLLAEGHGVRISGQDARRGTFSHRHSALVDYKNGQTIMPVASLAKGDAHFEVYNSILSEYGVMGFEYGYAVSNPGVLTVWEAQFGDFANGAQIMIDQFVSSSETKWDRMCGLVLLLPHGQEGQGPEHSSARLERFLQLCAEDNMTVVNPTTPAQIFHLLRRQVLRRVRRPLVVMSPKSLLRHADATSGIKELTNGAWQKVIDATDASKKQVSRIVLCSGKLYYDLAAEKKELGKKGNHVALVRLEQLYPLPVDEIKKVLGGYNKKAEIVWAQEEPRNQGAWWFLHEALAPEIGKDIKLISRPAMAAPAVGDAQRHNKQQREIIDGVFKK